MSPSPSVIPPGSCSARREGRSRFQCRRRALGSPPRSRDERHRQRGDDSEEHEEGDVDHDEVREHYPSALPDGAITSRATRRPRFGARGRHRRWHASRSVMSATAREVIGDRTPSSKPPESGAHVGAPGPMSRRVRCRSSVRASRFESATRRRPDYGRPPVDAGRGGRESLEPPTGSGRIFGGPVNDGRSFRATIYGRRGRSGLGLRWIRPVVRG